jgi:CO/xanthine dehydrogenase Mo-binding subunit/CO/xanthine dehydrogenase FAD-binding subunit
MVLGQRVRQADWEQRTTGAVSYVPDVRLPGTCEAAVLRSPHPHAEIRRLDVRRAAGMPGVVAVITAGDFGDARYVHHGGPLADRAPLARDRVRFVGEEVAAVAAETAEQARAAVAAIEVSYRQLPAVTDPAAALRRRAPRLHERRAGGNVALSVARTYGELPSPPPGAVSVRGRYRFARQAHACMETNGILASWDPETGRLHVWVSTQSPYFVRKELAHVLGLALDRVVTHEVAVGGGFGSKSKIGEHEALAAMLSMRAGRPVRLVLDRVEEFAATKARHEFSIDLRTCASAEGRLLTRHADLIVDNGAYNHTGPSVMGAGISVLASMYRTRGVRVDARLVDTNKTPGGQFRGYGIPQVTFAIECQLDELAAELDVDPIELRLANLLQAGDVTHAGLKIDSTRLAECLEAVRREIDWDARRAGGGRGHGVGVAAAMHVSGARTYPDANRSQARVEIDPGGAVVVAFGGADPGTGQRGLLAQAAATELGVPLEQVGVRLMDSEHTPFDLGSWSSRGTVMGVSAVRAAATSAAAVLRERAAGKLGTTAGAIRLEAGTATDGAQAIPIGDLVRLGETGEDLLAVEEEFVADIEQVDPVTGVANISLAYSFAAHAVAVEVDQATGAVRVVDYVAAHDTGTALNPTGVEGQIAGGVAMGLGAALGEELLYEQGRPVNPSYLHYPLPRAADLPPIRTVVIEHPDPHGPYGAKSVGEISLSPVAAAVANAVAHATGVRVRELPITPDKVRAAAVPSTLERTRRFRLWRRPDRWWIAAMRWAYPRGLHALLHRAGTRFARPRPVLAVEALERPAAAADAVATLAATPAAQPLAGGTDLLPAREQGLGGAPVLVDLTRAADLRTVEEADGDLVIGAAVSLAELAGAAADHDLGVLADTVARIASAQLREVATVGGNLCQQKRCWFFRNGFDCYKRSGPTCPCYAVEGDHRFHHAVLGAHRCQAVTPSDLATTLLALDARIVVQGPAGQREVAVDAFYTGPGETVLSAGEIVRAVRVPAAARTARHAYEKLALWHGDFAVVAAAVSLRLAETGDRIHTARVALGALAPRPWRAGAVERALTGAPVAHESLRRAARAWVTQAHPLRRNGWKIDAASGLVERALWRAAGHTGAAES